MPAKTFLIILSVLLYTSGYSQVNNLDYYISKGLSNSPLLKDYSNQVLSNSIDSQRLRAQYKPQVSLTSNNFYAPTVNGYGYDPIITNNGNYNALVNANQNFIGKKNINAQLETIKLQSDSVINERKISEQDLKRTITTQYITAYGDWQQLVFNNEIHKLLSQEDTILKKLAENNVYRQTDYLTFLVTLQQQEIQIKQLRIQFQIDFATLNYLCGIYDTSAIPLATPDITVTQPTDAASSVFYRKYVLDSLMLQNSISVLNYSYRPKLSAFVNAGYNTSFVYQAYKNMGTGVGVNFTMPIYDGHQRKMQYHKIALQQNTVANYRDFFHTQYDQQLAQLKQQLQNTESLISDINAQIKYSETLIKVNGQLLTTGDAKIADFVIAINNYLTAKNLLTQNNISKLQIINQINYWNR